MISGEKSTILLRKQKTLTYAAFVWSSMWIVELLTRYVLDSSRHSSGNNISESIGRQAESDFVSLEGRDIDSCKERKWERWKKRKIRLNCSAKTEAGEWKRAGKHGSSEEEWKIG